MALHAPDHPTNLVIFTFPGLAGHAHSCLPIVFTQAVPLPGTHSSCLTKSSMSQKAQLKHQHLFHEAFSNFLVSVTSSLELTQYFVRSLTGGFMITWQCCEPCHFVSSFVGTIFNSSLQFQYCNPIDNKCLVNEWLDEWMRDGRKNERINRCIHCCHPNPSHHYFSLGQTPQSLTALYLLFLLSIVLSI